MFGMGWQEIMLILVIGVLVIGPDQLPGVARTIGKLVAQFKRATNDLRTAVSEEIEQQEEFAEFKEFASDLESEVYDIQDTAKNMVDKEIEKGEKELDQLEAEISDSGDSMPSGEYGPVLDVADGDVMGGGNSGGEDSAAGDGTAGDGAAGDGAAGDDAAGDVAAGDDAAGDVAAGESAVGDSADKGGVSAADSTQKESA
ncbi:MAG: twin-arginine translocase subunit TatB [SAR324 cluster bacterium]|nr:twin-arginine translocase subunit TatB [SAR324 cluster bacterium]